MKTGFVMKLCNGFQYINPERPGGIFPGTDINTIDIIFHYA